MKLFDGGAIESPKLSQEQFKDYYRSASVVSMEAISDYFFKLKDTFNTINNSLFVVEDDTAVKALSTRFETEHVVKRLKLINVKDHTVLIPENFSGKYVDYLQDLLQITDVSIKSTEKTLSSLKLAISGFINEHSENNVVTLYGAAYFKDAEKLTEAHRAIISKYFKKSTNSVKSHVGDVLKSLQDVPQIYKDLITLDSTINTSKIKEISKTSNEASELVDVLIEQNRSSQILLKNDSVKKELINALYVTAKQVEFVAYLYSNVLFLHTAVKSLSDKLIEQANVN